MVGLHFLEKLLVELGLQVKAFKVLKVEVLEMQLKFILQFAPMRLIVQALKLKLSLPKVRVMVWIKLNLVKKQNLPMIK